MSDGIKGSGQSNHQYQYPKPIRGAVDSPREIGITDRVQGLNSGICEVLCRMEVLAGRLDGAGAPPKAANNLPSVGGLVGSLSDAEGNLRHLIELVVAIENKF